VDHRIGAGGGLAQIGGGEFVAPRHLYRRREARGPVVHEDSDLVPAAPGPGTSADPSVPAAPVTSTTAILPVRLSRSSTIQ